MSKYSKNNQQTTSNVGTGDEKYKKILGILDVAFKNLDIIANAYNTVDYAVNKKSTEKQDAETRANEVKNEAQRIHMEEQQEINKQHLELEKLKKEIEEGKDIRNTIKDNVSMLKAEYEKYINMDDERFFTEQVNARLSDLRNHIVEITRILMGA
ncbi:hypothetical protein [Butyrivibrio sp. WCD3002]|uniref:hypothetical protein n=1 Tax=Butyrivibrio sp. WCD3002 TaxID=1280676 RepID=UPI000419959E|nr:hypothetical protein [Butyrivibrio sp. WCD3002]